MLLIKCAHFFISEWLWSVTWDSYHIPFNIIILLLLLKFFLHINMVSAVFMSIASQFFACAFLSLVSVASMYTVGAGLSPENYLVVPSPLYASLSLGLLYTLFQVFFVALFYRRSVTLMASLAVIIFISNHLTVLITWLLYSID